MARKQRFENRIFQNANLTVERSEDGKRPQIVGHPAVFNQWTELWPGVREKVAPGSFAKTIQEADVRALFNHNENYVLGRNRSDTLALREDDEGLAFVIDPPDNGWANDLLVSIDRGDVNQASFAFRVIREEMFDNKELDTLDFTLQEVALRDVSVVTYPAYPQTDVGLRSILGDDVPDFDVLMRLCIRADRGLDLSGSDRDLLKQATEYLSRHVAPDLAAHPTDEHETPPETELEPAFQPRDNSTLLAQINLMRKRYKAA